MRTGLYTNPAFVSVDPPPGVTGSITSAEFAAPRPNPSRRLAQLEYAIPTASAGERMQLAIYDLAGRQVRLLESGIARAGRYHADWNLGDDSGHRVEPGLYFAQLMLGGESRSQKIIVVK
jgi:hypothetical protein